MKVFIFIRKYIFNLLIALDQFVNAILFGDPDETISSRLGKRRGAGVIWAFCADTVDFLFFWEKNHTKSSIEKDEGKDDLIK